MEEGSRSNGRLWAVGAGYKGSGKDRCKLMGAPG